MQLIVSPIYRLVSKSNAGLKDVGSPEQLILKVGNFVTGVRGRAGGRAGGQAGGALLSPLSLHPCLLVAP